VAASITSTLGPREVLASFDGPVGVYVHVPFCERICPFCPYNKVRARDDLATRYFSALHREIDWYVGERSLRGEGPFSSLYIGGGTPTLYPDELAAIIEQIPATAERAVEVLPTHGTREGLARLADAGVTAVSIGAQSFHDPVLRRLRRPHDAAASLAAVRHARELFGCVDVDLIVDVAWEDDDTLRGAFLADVDVCLAMGVDQLSTYPLMRFGYTPFGTAHHDRAREHEVLGEAARLAARRGYERRSVWTFNRVGAPAYTSITRPRYLGLGAGSASFAGHDFYVNHFGIGQYVQDVERGRLPVARWLHLGPVAGGLYRAFWQAYAGEASATSVRVPALLLGWVRRGPDGYRLTERGFDAVHDVERAVTYELIEPLWAQMLQEHRTSTLDCDAAWVRSEQARAGRAWPVVSRLFERPRAA
jgi:menaquinone C8-methyltransferase